MSACRIVSRQPPSWPCAWSQARSRFKVQRGAGGVVRSCGGVAASFRASRITCSTPCSRVGVKRGGGHPYADTPRLPVRPYGNDAPRPSRFAGYDPSPARPDWHSSLHRSRTTPESVPVYVNAPHSTPGLLRCRGLGPSGYTQRPASLSHYPLARFKDRLGGHVKKLPFPKWMRFRRNPRQQPPGRADISLHQAGRPSQSAATE